MSGEIVHDWDCVNVELGEEERNGWSDEMESPRWSLIECEMSEIDPLGDEDDEFDEDDFDDDFEEDLNEGLDLDDEFDAGDFDADGKDFNDPELDEEDDKKEVFDE